MAYRYFIHYKTYKKLICLNFRRIPYKEGCCVTVAENVEDAINTVIKAKKPKNGSVIVDYVYSEKIEDPQQ